jgi:alpha-beta hydrolase superfamily lysophospholipase
MRFEQRGFGDSEGEDFRTKDLDSEVKDNLAAVDYLMNREDVDENNVFVFGHSTGGVVAALVASQRSLAGVIPSCTIGRTYCERIIETLRLQGELRGDSRMKIENTITKYMSLIVPLTLGESLSEIIEKAPEVAGLVNSNGRIMDDRNVAYWHQQLNVGLADTYSKITEPVMIVYGTSDFLTQLACHETIRDVLTASGNSDVTLEVIPHLDHAYAMANDVKESFDNYKTRNFKKNPEVYKRIVEWLKQHAVE